MPRYLPDYLGSESGLYSGQMDPNSFGQPGSQPIGSFDDASITFKSTSGDCQREATGSILLQMDPNFFSQPRNELIRNFSNSSRNFKLMSGEMSNFPGNQEARVEMVKDMSSTGLHHSWSSSGVLDEVSVLLHQVSTHVFGYLNVPYLKCGSNLSKGLNNLLNSNRLAHLGGTSVAPQVQPPLRMYPHPPPWMSYTPPYMMKRRGSQVPLVYIPKLKPQAVVPAPKSSKKVQKKKSEVKPKKVASVSFLGVVLHASLWWVGSFIKSEIWRYEGNIYEWRFL
ncbi:hypothetical protein KY290_021645 [Solanum tuberosum]|uniref:Uncharacterized protein n=1 Tax=Solanum tuberosum TaxID=4113 RepID=A0ABQ7V471_SOLTU|nr:hypothetical protein KY290_021645 [Solanum tuberosum]